MNRLTEGTSFGQDDLRLLETLANQVAVALENGQLEQSLAELQPAQGAAPPPGLPRSADGPAQPGAVHRAGRARLSRPGRGPGRRSCCSSTSTTSRSSTTRLGHAAGDELLVAVADRIRRMRPRERPRRPARRRRVRDPRSSISPTCGTRSPSADALIDALEVPFQVLGHETVVGVSVGIADGRATCAGIVDGADDILRNADVAMYTAKAAGKRRFAVFDPAMHASIVARHELSAELRRGRRAERAGRPLPADRRPRQRPDRGRRGARPLAPSGPRADPRPTSSSRWPRRPGRSCRSAAGSSPRRAEQVARVAAA